MTNAMGKKGMRRGREAQAAAPQLPVFYNKGGTEVRASGTSFSPKGCVVYTKSPHNCGTAFSLKISHPKSNRSIQLDSSVIRRRRFETNKQWGMVVRFMNMGDEERDEIQQIIADAEAVSESAKSSRYLKTPIGQAIMKCFSFKKHFA